jgi:ribose 1,5-bisphosphate isomerase
MNIDKICEDIKNLKIQGAISVAKTGAEAFYSFFLENKSKENILEELKIVSEKLISTRSTEPALRNLLNIYLKDLDKCKNIDEIEDKIKTKYNYIINHFEEAKQTILEYASHKIKNHDIVYTHCHSSLVCDILIYTWNKGIKFSVYNTETRPLFQGRKTAKQLIEAGIPVTHFVDSAAKHAIKKADLILLGVDAISTTKIYNKIGSETIALIASSYDVPVYFCSDSWKFDPITIFGFDEEIEKRYGKEVWPDAPKEIKIYNYAFDQVSPKYVTAIISELGVYEHSTFIDLVRKKI